MQFKKSLAAAVVSAALGFTALASVAAPVTTEGTGVGKHGLNFPAKLTLKAYEG